MGRNRMKHEQPALFAPRRRGSGTIARAVAADIRDARAAGTLSPSSATPAAALRVAADQLDRLAAADASGYEVAAAARTLLDCYRATFAVAPAEAATPASSALASVNALRARSG
jgi:hypothetical protein